jgi:phosphohistidine phosphatase
MSVHSSRMKTILLMRHAKAEPGVPGQRDFDRSLAARGIEDASRMGRALAKLGAVPDAIVASPAARAKETAEASARAMKFDGTIHLARALYDASGEAWLAALRAIPPAAGSVLVVAHSPGIAEAAALLCGASPGAFDIPTGGMLAFDDAVERWRDLGEGGASLRWFLRPKLVEQL